jgi:peptide/nickel transport system substrate-binding protein
MSILEIDARSQQPMMHAAQPSCTQDVPQNSLQSIVRSGDRLAWGEDQHLPAASGVNGDGKPFTAADTRCTGTADGTGREAGVNPRNPGTAMSRRWRLGKIRVTFKLKRPQPALIALLARAGRRSYPCHVPARDSASARRRRPI